MAKTTSKGISLEAVHSALLEEKSTVSSIWDKLLGIESKLEKVKNENVKLKQENQKFKSLMRTEYFRLMNWTNTAEEKMLESLEYQRTTQLRRMTKNNS